MAAESDGLPRRAECHFENIAAALVEFSTPPKSGAESPWWHPFLRRTLDRLHLRSGVPVDSYRYKIFTFPTGIQLPRDQWGAWTMFAIYGGGIAFLWDPTHNQAFIHGHFGHMEPVRDVFQTENHWLILTVGERKLYYWNAYSRSDAPLEPEPSDFRSPFNLEMKLSSWDFFGLSSFFHRKDSISNVAQIDSENFVVEWASGATFSLWMKYGSHPVIKILKPGLSEFNSTERLNEKNP
jgi:hypothetical protein